MGGGGVGVRCAGTKCPRDSKRFGTAADVGTAPDHGIDYTAPAVVYLLHHRSFGAYKVGIANQTSGRTQSFASAGWETFRTYPLDTGDMAYKVEQAVLAPYRAASLCPYLTAAEMRSGGFTETIDTDAVSLLDLWAEVVAAADALVDHFAAQGGQRVR
jgi:hypothetical protein